MKTVTLNACAAALTIALASGCTFYTSCPDNPNPNTNTQAGSGNTGGNAGGGGTSNVTPVDEAKAKPWIAVTGNLEGTKSECGNLGTVTVKPDQDWVIASVARQGLFVSKDGDSEWVPLGQGKGSQPLDNRTSQLTFDPGDPNVFWESGMYGGCVYQTLDNGDTFEQLSNTTHCDSVSVDFTDPQRATMLAGGHEGRNLYKSIDAGQTWDDIGPNLPADAGFTGFARVLDAKTFLVASFSGKGSGIFRSDDGGDTWSEPWEGGIRSRPLFATDGAIYWVLSNQDSNQGLVRSEDNGMTWNKVPGSDGILSVEHALAELPGGTLATVGFTHLVISDDRGKSWREIGKKLPFAPAGMTYSPVRKLFYLWHFLCEAGDNPVPSDAIMTLEFDPASD